MSKKNEDVKAAFDLEVALKTVNPYFFPHFLEFISGEKISTQKQFDKLLKEYEELR